MTDYWPQEEGAVFDSDSYIIPCYPMNAISEMSAVKLGTSAANLAAGQISVLASTATGDGVGISLKAASAVGAPSRIPILFYGIAKVTGSAIANYYLQVGSFAMNNTTTTYLAHKSIAYNVTVPGGAASHVLGLVISGAAATTGSGDEVLLLVGKTS